VQRQQLSRGELAPAHNGRFYSGTRDPGFGIRMPADRARRLPSRTPQAGNPPRLGLGFRSFPRACAIRAGSTATRGAREPSARSSGSGPPARPAPHGSSAAGPGSLSGDPESRSSVQSGVRDSRSRQTTCRPASTWQAERSRQKIAGLRSRVGMPRSGPSNQAERRQSAKRCGRAEALVG
jgi:hypothetical protein